tara:strand:- start:2258 stop:2656 length:399 start_codon:yes stop_codon:yes gene_type:complete
MNELDLKTKIEGLEKAIKEHQDFVNTYSNTLTETKKQLDDYNKPELTPKQLDDIHGAVEKAVENYSFSDCDNYETEFSLDYDGRVQLESIDLQDTYELVEIIVAKVCSLFKEADCPEDKEAEELSDELNKAQ